MPSLYPSSLCSSYYSDFGRRGTTAELELPHVSKGLFDLSCD